MSQLTVYPVVTPEVKVSGGISGAASRIATMIYALIGGSDDVSGIPPTGGGASAGSPIGLLLALTKAS